METQADRDKVIQLRASEYRKGQAFGKLAAKATHDPIVLRNRVAEFDRNRTLVSYWYFTGAFDAANEEFRARFGSF